MNNATKRTSPVVGILKESLCIGGSERSAANISRLLENHYELHFLLFNGSDIKYSYGGNLVDIDAPPKNSLVGKFINSFIRYFKVKRVLRQKRIDILYEFINIKNMLSFISYKNTKRIISARDFGKVQRYTENFHKALSKADAMICNSEYIKDYYISKYPEHEDKVFTVYNAIDGNEISNLTAEQTEKKYNDFVENHSKIILVAGRFCKEKGFEYMLEAFAKATESMNLGLVMIGDGTYKEKYLKLIKELGIEDKVYFTGFQDNPYKYMGKSDIFVLSSLSEGFPNVLAEAMSIGLPVISSNCCSGPAEILRNDCDYEAVTDNFMECDYGILTPKMTEEDNQKAISSLADAMVHLASNENLLKKYSELSKHRALEYSPEVVAKKIEIIIKKLI